MKYKIKSLFIIGLILFTFKSFAQTVPNDTIKIVKEELPTVDGETIRLRLSALQGSVPLVYNEYVHAFVDFFTYRKPSFTKQMLERKNYFFPIFEEYLQKHNIPDEIKYLSLIESGLNPKAISYAGAAGLWQFMPRTGKIDFGLRIDNYVDERLHVQKSTEAACKYMKQLYRIFGDWELVLAAYNTGPGNVKRAIRKAGGGGFWQIYPYLHKQTRSYVPQYVAMIYMINHAADHGIMADINETIPESVAININNYLNLTTFASLSGITLAEIHKVNPHILKAELPVGTKDFELAIPITAYSNFDVNRAFILDSASKQIGKAPIVNPVILADQNEVIQESEETNTEVVIEKPSKKLRNKNKNEEENIVENESSTIKYHVVKRKENLTQIARKYGVAVTDLKEWNNLNKSSKINAGKKLKLYLTEPTSKSERLAAKKAKKEADRLEKIAIAENSNDKASNNRNNSNQEEEINNKRDKEVNGPDEYEEVVKKKPHVVFHTIKKGENLAQIANKYGLEIYDLKVWNNLKNTNDIQAGKRVKVYLENSSIKASYFAKASRNENEKTKVSGKSKYHKVQKGDTLWRIAQMYEGVTVDEIKKLNSIKGNNLKLGQKLKIS